MNRKKYLLLISIITVICIIVGMAVRIGHGARKVIDFYDAAEDIWDDDENTFDVWDESDEEDLYEASSEDRDTSEDKVLSDGQNISDFDKVVIDLDACEVYLQCARGDEPVISYEGTAGLEPVVKQKGDTLQISRKKHKKLHMLKDGGTLTIALPKDMELKSMTADIDAGTIYIKDCVIDKATIDVNAGSASLKNVSITNGQVDVDAGEVVLKDCTFEKMYVDVNAGDVEIKGTDLSDYTMKLDVDLGDITVNGKDLSGKNEMSRNYQQNGESGRLEIDVDMGSIDIKK